MIRKSLPNWQKYLNCQGVLRQIKNKDQMKAVIACMVTVFAVIVVNCTALAQVYQVNTTLVLNPIPSSMTQGSTLTFSGNLVTADEKNDPVPNKAIFIEYDSPYGCTRILAITTTDSNGNFDFTWKAVPKHQMGGTYYIFAKFNGDDNYLYSYSKIFPLTVNVKSSIPVKGYLYQPHVLLSAMNKDLPEFKTGFSEQVIDGRGGCNGN